MFENVPFGTMIIIRDWVNQHYVSKDKIREKISYYDERGYIEIAGALKELLEEKI